MKRYSHTKVIFYCNPLCNPTATELQPKCDPLLQPNTTPRGGYDLIKKDVPFDAKMSSGRKSPSESEGSTIHKNSNVGINTKIGETITAALYLSNFLIDRQRWAITIVDANWSDLIQLLTDWANRTNQWLISQLGSTISYNCGLSWAVPMSVYRCQ